MFDSINEKTFYVFGALMLSYIPLVYCFVPETAGRSLETIDFLFASNSWFVWNGEKEYRKRVDEFENRVGRAMDLDSKQISVTEGKSHEEERIA